MPATTTTIRPATPRDMDAIYRLVHDAYVGEGYIDPLPDGRFTDHYRLDGIPQTTTYVAEQDGNMVGTISWTMDGPRGLHTDADFAEDTFEFRRPGIVLGSSWRIATAQRLRGTAGIRVVMGLIESTASAGLAAGVTDALYTFHPHHERVYAAMLGMTTLARIDESSGLHAAPAVLMHNRAADLNAYLRRRNAKRPA